MDLHLIKTFLTLAETKRLSACAEQLCLTKSAVSTRIKQLEKELEQPLFERTSKGMVLSHAGQQFYQHALIIRQRWARAKQEIHQSDASSGLLRLGAHPALAQDLLLPWGQSLRQQCADLTLSLEANYSAQIVRSVAAGTMDVGLILVADAAAGLVVEQVMEDPLILVSTSTDQLQQIRPETYLYLDWGWGYNAAHSERLPQLANALTLCGSAELGLPWLLETGGAAYLPRRKVANHLASGTLKQVVDAPVFMRPIFMTHSSKPLDQAVLDIALNALSDFIQHLP